jgi:hypothetical protein
MTDSEKVLRVDANYRNTADWKQPSDQFNKFFRFEDGKGIANASGFRPKSRLGGSTDILNCAFDLSPNFHPPMSRVPVTFEPKGLGEATGRGAEPSA